MASELEAAYLDACNVVRCSDLWCAEAWCVIYRLSPPPLPLSTSAALDFTPYTTEVLSAPNLRCASQLPDWRGVNRRPSAEEAAQEDPALYLRLLCRLFPTSAAVSDVALLFLRAGRVSCGLAAMRVALDHGSAWPMTWINYVAMLRTAQCQPEALEAALRRALHHVGLDPRSGPLWAQLLQLLCARATAAPTDGGLLAAAREAFYCAMSMPLAPDDSRDAAMRSSMSKAEEVASKATGNPARDALPAAVGEAHRVSRDAGAKVLAGLPAEVAFPSPSCDANDLTRWQRCVTDVRRRRTNPCHFVSAALLRRHVILALRQACQHFCRQAAPHVLFVAELSRDTEADDASTPADALQQAATYVLGLQPTLLLESLAADLALPNPFKAQRDPAAHTSSTIAFLKEQSVQYRRLVASDGSSDAKEQQLKALKKALRDVGKQSTTKGTPEWQKFDQWAAAEITALHDVKTLLPEVTRRSLALCETAATNRSIPAAAVNLTQLSLATARWAKLSGNEADTRASLERTVRLTEAVGGKIAPEGLRQETWAKFAEAEVEMRGLRDGEKVMRRQFKGSLGDGDMGPAILAGAVPWGTAAHRQLVSHFTVSSGGHVCLTPTERTVYRFLGDVERSALASKEEKESGFRNPELMQLSPHVADPLRPFFSVDASSAAWVQVRALPSNDHPPLPQDDQNSDELCAPRAMKPPRKLIIDNSATAAPRFAVQKAADPNAEFFGPSTYAKASDGGDTETLIDGTLRRDANTVRLPVQLQSLVDMCRGLPLGATALDIRVEWIEATINQKNFAALRYEPKRRT